MKIINIMKFVLHDAEALNFKYQRETQRRKMWRGRGVRERRMRRVGREIRAERVWKRTFF